MASESSSAVLELNDGDYTEDTEPPSVTEDVDEVPLIMEHGYDIAVKVDAPLKQLSTLETFVTYRVRCVCARWTTPPYVRRRYNHFKALHKRLTASHPLIAPPPLPPLHSARQQLDRYSPSFVAIRTLALNAFLDRVAKHPILTHSEELRLFVTTPDEDVERALKTEGGGLQLWGLGALAADRPGNGPRVKDPEFRSASEYLSSLQQKLSTLCTLTTKLHQGSAALGNDLMGMKRVCDAWWSQAGGLVARAAGAAAEGCASAAAARATAGAPLAARATLPLLAAYACAHLDKIKHRDSLHANYVSGNHTTGDVHNRLEQASEALRSELADWVPKTHAEIKSLLLEIAERQVAVHSQAVSGWERAQKLSVEADVGDVFKTVSKSAVQNLSPSKYNATPTLTDGEFDDFASNSSAEFDLSKSRSDENYEVVGENGEELVKSDNELAKSGNELAKSGNELAKSGNELAESGNELANSGNELAKSDNELARNGEELSKSSDEIRKEMSEVLEEELKNGVHSDPLRDFAEVDLSS